MEVLAIDRAGHAGGDVVDDAPGQPVGAEDERLLLVGYRSGAIAHV